MKRHHPLGRLLGAVAAVLIMSTGLAAQQGGMEETNPRRADEGDDPHERLMPLWDAIGQDNMPSLCKYAQSLQGVPAGVARRPTSPATEAQKGQRTAQPTWQETQRVEPR